MKQEKVQQGRMNVSKKTQTLALTAVLTGILVLMAFTPLGYFNYGAVEITLLMIPIVIGSIVLGPRVGMFLGCAFGITSFIMAISGLSAFGAILVGYNPVFTFIICIIPRILAGIVPGLVFKGVGKIDKSKNKVTSFAIASLSGSLTNTVLFICGLFIFFWNSDFIITARGTQNVFVFFFTFIGVNGLIEAAACLVLGTAISKALAVALKKF